MKLGKHFNLKAATSWRTRPTFEISGKSFLGGPLPTRFEELNLFWHIYNVDITKEMFYRGFDSKHVGLRDIEPPF